MPWFRLEESFATHPKVVDAGNAAVGLWIRCATWSAQHLTDGHIPAGVARSMMGRPGELDTLERVRLWLPASDGDGYDIPDYLDYQPAAADVKARRAADAERKRQGRGNGSAAVEHDELGRFKARHR